RRDDGRECHNCGQVGHIARNCRDSFGGRGSDSKCFNCGNMGHFARDCTEVN
ncbi:hypothetical protein H4R99_007573, partial [Coemansia sp. RSA 1722]